MPILKGMSWDHPRGFDPMVATAEELGIQNNVFFSRECI